MGADLGSGAGDGGAVGDVPGQLHRRTACPFYKEPERVAGSLAGRTGRAVRVGRPTSAHPAGVPRLSTCTGPCCSSLPTTQSTAATCGLGTSWLLEPSVDR